MNTFERLNKRYLLSPKILYFTLSTAFYIFHQFRAQFIVEKYGMEKDKLGLYLSIPQAISFFTNIWAGSINDSSGKQRSIIVSLLLISAVFFQSFFFSNNLLLFWIEFTFYFSFISATLPLLDKFMLDYLSAIPGMGPKTLGPQRLWCTFGYLAINFIIEHAITTSGSNSYNYDKMQYFNIAAVSIAAIFLLLFVKNLPKRTFSSDLLSSTKTLLRNFEYLYFIFIILLCGISRAFMTNYLGFYYAKVLKFNNQKNTLNLFWPLNIIADAGYNHKQSTATLFGVTFDIAILYYSAEITIKLGLFLPILLSQVFQTLRFIAYYNLSYENPNSFAYCCLIELLKGANYALIHMSAVQLANSLCPPHLRTTSQLLYSGTFISLGTILSGLVFMNFFSKGVTDVESCYEEFHQAFKWNILFSLLGIGFFVYKYGIKENLIFNRENAERKIKEAENKAKFSELIEETEQKGARSKQQIANVK
ncbi:hypothetical protein GINT2_002252 [Glugoides intestinalis]